MSRLIDADEFINELEDLYHRVGWGERDVHFSLADIKSNIDMMPTVEAIPVEWIKKYGEAHFFDYGTQYNAITLMLEAWGRMKEE